MSARAPKPEPVSIDLDRADFPSRREYWLTLWATRRSFRLLEGPSWWVWGGRAL